FIGELLLDVALDDSAAEMLCSAHVTCVPLALFADVNHSGRPAVQLLARVIDTHLAYPGFRVLDQLQKSRGMFHKLAGMRLPVSCRKPRCALRRATSSAVATAAAESAVHAKA